MTVMCPFRWQYIQLVRKKKTQWFNHSDCLKNMGLKAHLCYVSTLLTLSKTLRPPESLMLQWILNIFPIKIQFTDWHEKIVEGSKSWKSNLTLISKCKRIFFLLLFTLFFSAWELVQSASLLDVTGLSHCALNGIMAPCIVQSHTDVMVFLN